MENKKNPSDGGKTPGTGSDSVPFAKTHDSGSDSVPILAETLGMCSNDTQLDKQKGGTGSDSVPI